MKEKIKPLPEDYDSSDRKKAIEQVLTDIDYREIRATNERDEA